MLNAKEARKLSEEAYNQPSEKAVSNALNVLLTKIEKNAKKGAFSIDNAFDDLGLWEEEKKLLEIELKKLGYKVNCLSFCKERFDDFIIVSW